LLNQLSIGIKDVPQPQPGPKLLNLIAKGKIARETQATLNAAKATIEAACRTG
jgi:hypothetical protein